MSTITPIEPGLTGAAESVPGGATPTAADVIPCAAYRSVLLIYSGTTSTLALTVDDPTTPAIPGAKTPADPDMGITLAAGQTYSRLLPTARYRDANGNINITTSGTVGDAKIKCYGIV